MRYYISYHQFYVLKFTEKIVMKYINNLTQWFICLDHTLRKYKLTVLIK